MKLKQFLADLETLEVGVVLQSIGDDFGEGTRERGLVWIAARYGSIRTTGMACPLTARRNECRTAGAIMRSADGHTALRRHRVIRRALLSACGLLEDAA